MDILASINHSLSLVTRLRDVSKNVAEAEFKNLLADLASDLADAKIQVADLKHRLVAQAEEIAALKAADGKTKVKPSGFQWRCYKCEGEEGLFCTGCYDSKGKKSRTNRLNINQRSCPVPESVTPPR